MVRCDGMFSTFRFNSLHSWRGTYFVCRTLILYSLVRQEWKKTKNCESEKKIENLKWRSTTNSSSSGSNNKICNIDARNIFYVMQLCVPSKRDLIPWILRTIVAIPFVVMCWLFAYTCCRACCLFRIRLNHIYLYINMVSGWMKRKKHKWQNGFGECAQHKIIIVIFWYAVRSVGVNDDAFWDSVCIMCVFDAFLFRCVSFLYRRLKITKL